jgi:hypothetical protein
MNERKLAAAKNRDDGQGCPDCGYPLHAHDRDRVYPDDGPAGSYHYTYDCDGVNRPDGTVESVLGRVRNIFQGDSQ